MIDHNAFLELQRFAKGLKECLTATRNDNHDITSQSVFSYVDSIIDLHLNLKEIDFNQYAYDLEKHAEKVEF